MYAGRAHDGPLVAIKLLHPHLVADGLARERFLREVETAKRVAPFCTAQLLDSGFAWTRPYIVSEHVPGPSLQSSVRDDGPRGAAALHRLAINTATALAAIHAAGVVHRDFKPANVLLGPDGPVVIDFGIAKALDQSQSVISSQPFGSPAYMAPEQISNGDVGAPADLFAWAATMYYAATGRRAFPGEGIPATLHAVLSSEPDLTPVDERLRWLLRDCLSKDPARRPTSAQVVERLRASTGVTDRPSPTTSPTPAAPPAPATPPTPAAPPAPTTPPAMTPGGPLTPPHGFPATSPPNGPLTPPHGFPATASVPDTLSGGRSGGRSGDTAPRGETVLGTGPVRGGGRVRVLKVAVPVGAVALIAAAGIGWHTLSPAVSQPEAAARTPVPTLTERTPEPTPTSTEPPPRKAKDLASATSRPKTATPTASRRLPTSTAPPTPAERTPTPSATAATRRPATRTPKPTPKPTRSPAARRTTSAPAPEPSTATITWSDVNAYCKAKGYRGSYNAGWGYTRCNGSESAVDPASVCRWKYPDYANATAEPPANPWMPSAQCQLS